MYYVGCYTGPGNSAVTIQFNARHVGADMVRQIKATVPYIGDPGTTKEVGITAMRATVSVTPNTLIGASGVRASGSISLNAPLANSLSTRITTGGIGSVMGQYQDNVQIAAGQSAGSFTYSPPSVSAQTTATLSAEFPGIVTPTTVTIVPGWRPENVNGGRCDPGCDKQVGLPIDVTSGNTWVSQTDWSLPGLGNLQVERTWNSLWTRMSPLALAGRGAGLARDHKCYVWNKNSARLRRDFHSLNSEILVRQCTADFERMRERYPKLKAVSKDTICASAEQIRTRVKEIEKGFQMNLKCSEEDF